MIRYQDRGCWSVTFVLGGALMLMYAKCGAPSQAQCVVERIPSCAILSWTAWIAGYAYTKQGQQALDCFKQMWHEDILLDEVTYVCILNASTAIGAIDKGEELHDKISRQGLMSIMLY